MNTNGTLIESLKRSRLYRDFESAYTEVTGLPVSLRSVETWQLPLHGKRKENPFCALMAEKSRTCAACLQMQEDLARGGMEGPCAKTCAYGLTELAVPIKLGPQTIGFLQTGQVLRRKPTEARFRRVVARTGGASADWKNGRARAAFFRTPVVSSQRLSSVTALLSIFAVHLSQQGNQIAVQQENAEPPVIARAKQFIRQHYSEDLTLGQVSSAVHTSLYYFCKLFRRVTGLTFTEFVSRTRVEKAKNLLLNPNLRISEIAYESGFQSLTHFNRVFRNVVGESPTDYRGRLPGVARNSGPVGGRNGNQVRRPYCEHENHQTHEDHRVRRAAAPGQPARTRADSRGDRALCVCALGTARAPAEPGG
jgi:AraC-like DNA-binding protein/ligand-binding sensor protein